VPSFCRHNRLIQNCTICSRELEIEARPIVSSGTPGLSAPRPAGGAGRGGARGGQGTGSAGSGGGARAQGRTRAPARAGGVSVRRLARGAEDGYQSALVPGLKSSADADRLASELAFAAVRLELLADDPPGLIAEVAAAGDVEERTWLAFQIVYICPLDDDRPFASIEAARTTWASGELPDVDAVKLGPRSPHEPGRGVATLAAYRAWAARASSQALAFAGEASWTPERRFARVFERLALPGMHRDARYDLLVVLGRTGVYELRGGALQLVGDNDTTVAAKRALGIGDTLLLDRRAAELAEACEVPLESLDLALYNWGIGRRVRLGVPAGVEPSLQDVERIQAALGL